MLKSLNNVVNRRFSAGIDMSVAFFSLFSSWLLSVSFFGQSLNARMIEMNVVVSPLQITFSILAQFIGLLLGGIMVRTIYEAKRKIMVSLNLCIIGTVVFLFPYSILWDIFSIINPIIGGIVVASWGDFFRRFKSSSAKLQAAGSVLIYSNIGMIILNVIAVNISPILSLLLSMVFLILSMICCYRCKIPGKAEIVPIPKQKNAILQSEFKKSLILLYIFISIITIDSGIMYQVVNPAFSHLETLTSIYWAIPYILAIFIIKKLPGKVNRSYILYLAVTMIGFAYILFFALDNSSLSYITIDTVMLGAFGICDLFWWVILGDMLDFTHRPASIFGIGLSANILGVLIGSTLCSFLPYFDFGPLNYTTVTIGIVFISLIVLPILYNNLSRLIKGQAFLVGLSRGYEEMSDEEIKKVENAYMKAEGFTGREIEIAELLMAGRTYKMISQELFISENTVKTHIKNIYTKSDVKSKTEFMMKITQNK